MKNLLFFSLAVLSLGCAYDGVVVSKELNPHEFPLSLGVVASPKLYLRNSAGAVNSQLVTLAVFERYQPGDYFNDEQAGPTRSESDFKQPVMAVRHASATTHRQTSRIASKASHHRQVASKAHHRRQQRHIASAKKHARNAS